MSEQGAPHVSPNEWLTERLATLDGLSVTKGLGLAGGRGPISLGDDLLVGQDGNVTGGEDCGQY